jgi:hypothetical protein
MAPDLFIPMLLPPKAPEDRECPRLWIRRLAIFENETTIRRDVPLKPGLNIIWSPDLSSSGRQSLAHGSGKTTFCRLIRACLGETGYSTEAQQNRILQKMPKGFFAAEVMIDGTCWVSVRSFGLGESYATRADSVEAAIQRGKQSNDEITLDHIIRDAFFRDLVGLTPPEIDTEHTWDILRSWITRDQECRLADILAWRSVKTQTRSRAQVVSEAAKLAMVRLAIRGLDRAELEAGVRERKLSRDAEEERRRQAFLAEQRTARLKLLRSKLGMSDEIGLEDALENKGLISLAQSKFEAAMEAGVVSQPPGESFVAELQQLNAMRSALIDDRSKIEFKVQSNRKDATFRRSEAERGQIDMTQGGVRVCPICRVPVDEVLATQCRISLRPCNVDAIKIQIVEKQKQADLLDDEATGLEAQARVIALDVARIDGEIRALQDRAGKADAMRKASRAAMTKVEDAIYEARRLLDEARALQREFETPITSGSLGKELETLRIQLEEGRSRASKAIMALETQYRAIMAAWLPDGVDGIIRLDGKGLKVDVEFNGRGEVSTAALDSLKIIAFDLAVHYLATEEKVLLPAFLIHDSPREADLDGMLYGRLFEMVAGWESGSGTPGFQYIVTTTTAPPSDLQGSHFVKLKMSSTPESERLFRFDL